MQGPDPDAERSRKIAEFQRRDKWRRRLPLLPALLFTIVVTQIPFLFNIWFSLQDWTIVPPYGPEFVGIENYTEGYSNQFFHEAVIVSVGMTVSAVLLSLLVGTILALLLDHIPQYSMTNQLSLTIGINSLINPPSNNTVTPGVNRPNRGCRPW